MDNPQPKDWLLEKVNRNPDYLKHYLTAIEKLAEKAKAELYRANREGTLEQIKYQMGWLDGVQAVLGIPSGLKLSEAKKPAGPGLMARILGQG